jgi:hypothetical protein
MGGLDTGDTALIRIAAPVRYEADDDTFSSVLDAFTDPRYRVALSHIMRGEVVDVAIEAHNRRGARQPPVRDASYYTRRAREYLHEHFFGAWQLVMHRMIPKLPVLEEGGAVLSLHTGQWRSK